jgi:hypothetical protein
MTRARCHNRVRSSQLLEHKYIIPLALHPILLRALLSNLTLPTSRFESLLPGEGS